MKRTAVIYWSGTGNTKAMAEAVYKGMQEGNAEASLIDISDLDASTVSSYDAIAFGCPAMGAESLEENEFEPVFRGIEAQLSGKNIILFGSYGWGNGEWMHTWEERCQEDGAHLVTASIICNGSPDVETLDACEQAGKKTAAL